MGLKDALMNFLKDYKEETVEETVEGTVEETATVQETQETEENEEPVLEPVQEIAQEIDYDKLATLIAKKMPNVPKPRNRAPSTPNTKQQAAQLLKEFDKQMGRTQE